MRAVRRAKADPRKRARWVVPAPTRILTIVVGCLLANSSYAQEARHQISIKPQSLIAALNALAAQTGLQIVVMSQVTANKQAPAVSGDLTNDEALAKILRDTGLSYQKIDNNTVAIKPAPTPPAAPIAADAHRTLWRSAQEDSGVGTNGPGTGEPPRNESRTVLEEVVVTGSHIRGVRNDTAPVLILGRDYIDRSGYTTMTQLVGSLPMNFSGGQNGSSEVAGFGNAPGSSQNLTRGTGFNLHGLGSVATLTLINGRRIAPAAEGQFVDISTIPLAAVERVEILTDGASAVYGADAVAGVVNVILRKDFDGAETSVDVASATRGGTAEQRVSQTIGKTWAGGNALLVADWSKRDPLDARDRDYIVNAGGVGALGPTWLLAKRNTGSLVFTLDQSLPGNLDLLTNVLYSHEKVDQATTDPTETIATSHPITNAWSALLGLGYQPFGDWRFELDGLAARMETVTSFNYTDIPTDTIQLLWTDYRDRFDMYEGDFKADGSLFPLPAGEVRLATGASFRDDQLRSGRNRIIPNLGYQARAEDHRHVTSVFAEVFVPLVSRELDLRLARRIDLSLAGRYDDYSDFGNTWNPKYGLVWTPVDGLDIRASYGTSFRAPSVAEKALIARGQQIYTGTVDSADGSGAQVPIFFLQGSAPLSAEKSRNLSLGFTLQPVNLPGAQLSASYFKIDYRNQISSPPFDGGMLFHRDQFGSLITELPSDAASQAYLDSRLAAGDTFFDYAGTGGATGVRYILDDRQQNAARTHIDGADISAAYQLTAGLNTFDLHLNLARLNNIRTSLLSNTTSVDLINNYEQPLKTKARLMGSWLRRGWNDTVSINYANSYTNTEVIPAESVKAWTTVDLNVSYDFSAVMSSGVLAGSKVSLSVTNLFDVDPPLTRDPIFSMGYDVFNADALGRYITLHLGKHW
jgi:iron complex outermembrane receptor protein